MTRFAALTAGQFDHSGGPVAPVALAAVDVTAELSSAAVAFWLPQQQREEGEDQQLRALGR